MTPALVWHDVFTNIVPLPTDDLWLRLVWQTLWFVPLVWCLCRLLHRRCPAVRTWLWWAGCVQMLGVSFAAQHALLSDDAGTPVNLLRLLMGIWGVGLTTRIVLLAMQFRRARRLVQECVPAPPCPATETAACLASRLAVRLRPTILVSPRLKMPALAGLGRPTLLLPASALDLPVTAELRMALAHELAHLRRRDLWLGLTPVLAQTLLFFHPFVWLAVREYALAREEACDAEARRVTQTSPDEYGAMLLGYVTAARGSSRAVSPKRSDFQPLRMRLKALHPPGQKSRSSSLVAFCAVCVFGAAGISVLQMLPSTTSRMASAANGQSEADRLPYDRLSEEFSQDTTYSQPIILPPKHHRRISHSVAGSRLQIAEAAHDTVKAAMPSLRVTKPSVERRVAALPRPLSRRIEKQSFRADDVAKVLPLKEAASAHVTTPMTVASTGDTPPPHSAVGRSDLGALDTALQALQQQMKQRSAPEPTLDRASSVRQSDEQSLEQSGPQFQQRWKHHILELHVETGRAYTAIRVQNDTDVEQPLAPSAPSSPQAAPLFLSPTQTRIREKVILEIRSSSGSLAPLAMGTW